MEEKENELLRIEANFHKLIDNRILEGELDPIVEYPKLLLAELDIVEPQWFPIEGMYGGFLFSLGKSDGHLELTCESWCRIVGGSGQRHRVTKDAIELLDEGFV